MIWNHNRWRKGRSLWCVDTDTVTNVIDVMIDWVTLVEAEHFRAVIKTPQSAIQFVSAASTFKLHINLKLLDITSTIFHHENIELFGWAKPCKVAVFSKTTELFCGLSY